MIHLDELTHWLYAVKGLDGDQLTDAGRHLAECPDCASSQWQFEKLDGRLLELALSGSMSAMPERTFDADDPFRRRPRITARPKTARLSRADSVEALAASERAMKGSATILDSIKAGADPAGILRALSLQDSADRFALLYTLQEAGRQSAANPVSMRTFAEKTAEWIGRRGASKVAAGLPERLVPRLLLRAHAHLLLAITLLWLKEFSRARAHLIVAYRSFARADADEASFALVEAVEAQRRSLAGDGRTALALARRARRTFESYVMEDNAARATVIEGLAHCALNDHEEAVRAYRSALPVFERHQLWSNYIGALNSVANSLTRVGRFEEARREYARVLRRFSHVEHRYWLGYVRIGLAEALFAAGRFAEAARAAAQAGAVFKQSGLRAHQLIALLQEVESWARAREMARARSRLDVFRREVERDHALDPAVQRELVAALSGKNPDYEHIGWLRRSVSDRLQERYRA